MSHPAAQIILQAAREQGWEVHDVSDALVSAELQRLGYRPADVETQFRLGPYRLDFAIPAEQIDIEADGWVHTARDARARDARRDRQLREWGWTVIRVDAGKDVAAQVRSRLPDRSRIADYGDTLRAVSASFKAALDRLQRRGVTDPAEQLGRVHAALHSVFRSLRADDDAGLPANPAWSRHDTHAATDAPVRDSPPLD